MDNFECEEYYFSSNFDSGNLRKVELVASCSEPDPSDYIVHVEFDLWTSPDCYGTPYENLNRTWFFFSIKGGRPFRNVKLNVKNLNRQAKLFSQGMQPVMRIGELGKWERIKDKPEYASEADCFYISFYHRPGEDTELPYYYAFTYPFTYTENLNLLDKLDKKYGRNLQTIEHIVNRLGSIEREERENAKNAESTKANSTGKTISKDPANNEATFDVMAFLAASPSESAGDSSAANSNESIYDRMTRRELQNEIYYHRELLIHSLEKRRVDLLTISSYHGIQNDFEERLSNLFADVDTPRCRNFKDKKIIFMSSRVHPGETAASFVLNGFLNLILDRRSMIGQMLRKMYVFKIVPFLNPDGVFNGLYRTDTLGQNLNRMYIRPQIDRHPSIYAVKKLIKYYHLGYDRFDQDNEKFVSIEVLKPATPPSEPPPSDVVEKKDEINSTASLFDFVEKLRSETSKIENEALKQRNSSKEATSSEGEENNSPTTVQNLNIQPPGSSGFGKKADHHARKNLAIKTVFGTNHGSLSRSSDIKLKDLQNTTSVQRPKLKKLSSRKEVKMGNPSNLSLRALNKRNMMCCRSLDISIDHSVKGEDGIENPEKSNLFLYMDFHGHASKKGIFMYGNHFQNTPEAVECMLLPRLMGVNCQHFHYDACNFSERNMYRREKRDGLSKEGSGRVAVYKMTGLIKCYTLESNYNTGKYVNSLPTRMKDVNQKPSNIVPPKYAPALYEEVGRALGPSILDITNSNSMSRIYNSEYRSVQSLRIAIRNELERSGSRMGVNGGKTISSHPIVKRVKRSSLPAVSTPTDVPKENKLTYHSNLKTVAASVLNSLNPPPKAAPRATRCIKRNPLKAHSTNLYGKKDSIVNKKKPKAVLLLETASGSSSKDHNFLIPSKKVRVSPTHTVLTKEPSPPARTQGVESIKSIDGACKEIEDIESSDPVEVVLPSSLDVETEKSPTTDCSSYTLPKPDMVNAQLSNSSSMTQFYSAVDMPLLKKCSSESGIDAYVTKADLPAIATSSNNILACRNTPGVRDEVVASCSPRLIVHPSIKKPLLATFRKTKKVDSFLLKGRAGEMHLKATLNSKLKSAFGGSEDSKLAKKKRIIRHDSLIVKRKKNKVKIVRH